MGKNNRKVSFKKNEQMRNNYCNFVKKKTRNCDETACLCTLQNLESSDESSAKIKEDIPVSKTPFYYKLLLWWKANKTEIIMTIIIIPFVIWIFNTKLELSKINIKIDGIEESIKDIKLEYSTKLELNLQLDNIQKNLGYGINYEEINKKLDNIQLLLDQIKN